MKIRLSLLTIALGLMIALTACGGSAPAMTIDTVPTYPGATALDPKEDAIAATLAQNTQQSAAMSAQLGVSGQVDQKGFSLPKDATWDQVKAFYDDKLKSSGWSSNSLIDGVMEQANQDNDMFQIANWQHNKQNLSVMVLTDPTDQDKKILMLSLSSQ